MVTSVTNNNKILQCSIFFKLYRNCANVLTVSYVLPVSAHLRCHSQRAFVQPYIFPIQNCEQKSEILKNAIVKLAQDQKELTTGMQISTYQGFLKCEFLSALSNNNEETKSIFDFLTHMYVTFLY